MTKGVGDEAMDPPVPIALPQPPEEAIAPSPPFDPSAGVKSIILSVTSLPISLIQFLHETFTQTTFYERDLSLSFEGDIVVSSNRCIIFLTQAQITQALPCFATSRIQAVSDRYRCAEIIVQCYSLPKGKDLASFQGWLTALQKYACLRIFYALGNQELFHWTAWLCAHKEIDGPPALLSDEETEVPPSASR